jgi:hypothetical protein
MSTLHFLSFKLHPTTLYYSLSLHFTKLHSTLLPVSTLHFLSFKLPPTTLHYTCRHFTSPHLKFTQLHFTTLSYHNLMGLTRARNPDFPYLGVQSAVIMCVHLLTYTVNISHAFLLFFKQLSSRR